MCLYKIKKEFKANDNIMYGYKVYEKCKRAYKDRYMGNIRRIGLHYKSGSGCLSTRTGRWYENGFHVYSSLKEAKRIANWTGGVVCEVLIWDIRVKGSEMISNVIVAKNLRIMREIS